MRGDRWAMGERQQLSTAYENGIFRGFYLFLRQTSTSDIGKSIYYVKYTYQLEPKR